MSDGNALPAAFPKTKLFAAIRAVKTASERVYASPDDYKFQLDVHDRDRSNFMVLYKLREQNRGRMSDNGVIKNLPFAAGQHPADPTYIAFFDRNIIGFLYYNEGAKPKRFVQYLNTMFSGNRFDLAPIFRKDMDAALRELSLQALELRIDANQAMTLSRNGNDPFAEPLAKAGSLLEKGSVQLRLSVGQKGKVAERNLTRAYLGALIDKFRGSENVESYKRASVQGTDSSGEPRPIDLIAERFIHRAKISAEDPVLGPDLPNHSPLIRARWLKDKAYLEAATPELDDPAEVPDLLGEFQVKT